MPKPVNIISASSQTFRICSNPSTGPRVRCSGPRRSFLIPLEPAGRPSHTPTRTLRHILTLSYEGIDTSSAITNTAKTWSLLNMFIHLILMAMVKIIVIVIVILPHRRLRTGTIILHWDTSISTTTAAYHETCTNWLKKMQTRRTWALI